MVLGISLSRRGKKSKDDGQGLRPSPSLPQLAVSGFSWPENLVHLPTMQDPASAQSSAAPPKATLFQPSTITPKGGVRFRKPSLRRGDSASTGSRPVSVDGTTMGLGFGSIAAMFTRAPSAFSRHAQAGTNAAALAMRSRSQRRAPRIAPTFNIMVAGSQGTGKTSLLKMILDTCELSAQATPEQKLAVETFMEGGSRKTKAFKVATTEIFEGRFDRIMLTVIDTPGLDFAVGEELELERSVSDMVRYIESQYGQTMGEESKVVRQSTGDQHVHLCIYLIDPDSIVSTLLRNSSSPKEMRSHRKIQYQQAELPTSPSYSGSPGESRRSESVRKPEEGRDSEEDYEKVETEDAAGAAGGEQEIEAERRRAEELGFLKTRKSPRPAGLANDAPTDAKDMHQPHLSPAELRIIKRLSARVNILPVVARADSLTNERLAVVKQAIRNGLAAAGLAAGVFGWEGTSDKEPSAEREEGGQAEEEEEEHGRHVIKIKSSSRRSLSQTRSRSRWNLDNDDEEALQTAALAANGDTGPSTPTRGPLESLLPFAVFSPEPAPPSRLVNQPPSTPPRPSSTRAQGDNTRTPAPSVQGHQRGASASSTSTSPQQAPHAKLSDLRGRFVRKYRWGVIDALDPDHCDFAALRTAVLGTHIKDLKKATKDKYEIYRTEKLLARRATARISDAERERMINDLVV